MAAHRRGVTAVAEKRYRGANGCFAVAGDFNDVGKEWLFAGTVDCFKNVHGMLAAAAREIFCSHLRACSRNEASDLRHAVAILIGPHDSGAELVRFGHDRFVRHVEPFAVQANAIVALAVAAFRGVPIDILDRDAIGEGAAQALAAGQAVEPGVQFWILRGVAAIEALSGILLTPLFLIALTRRYLRMR